MDDRAGNELPLTSYYRTEKHGRNFHYKIRGIWK
jgi:hypothetical protein